MSVLGSGLRRGGVSYVSVVCRVRPCVTVAQRTRTGGGVTWRVRCVQIGTSVCVCPVPVACSARRPRARAEPSGGREPNGQWWRSAARPAHRSTADTARAPGAPMQLGVRQLLCARRRADRSAEPATRSAYEPARYHFRRSVPFSVPSTHRRTSYHPGPGCTRTH